MKINKNRCNRYIGTFENTSEGIKEYKQVIKSIRLVMVKGRFVKMFRQGTRSTYETQQGFKMVCGSTKNDGKRFDVYVNYSRGNNETEYKPRLKF